jgi:periplasmic divalent cation tolerance protein
MKLLAVYTTVGARTEARRIAQAVVERGLAACAQISEIESFYTWKGVVQNEPEFRILFKTTEAGYTALETAIRALHPYELPAIHAVVVDHVFEPYAAWVEEGSAAC